MARKGTNTPPQPPASTAALVEAARSSARPSSCKGVVSWLSAHTIAAPPGPKAAAARTSPGTSLGTTKRINSKCHRTFMPQPTTPPLSIAAARGAVSGIRRRAASSSMKKLPTSGMPIRAETLAAPPPIARGRARGRSRGRALPSQLPLATPMWAAGDSVPIGAPSPTVARFASDLSGARCQGKRSSAPAALTTSPVRSARAMSWGKLYQEAREPRVLAGASSRGAIVCRGCPLPRPNRISTATAMPSRGRTCGQGLASIAVPARQSLISSVSSTAAAAPISPPSMPAQAQARVGRALT